MIGIPHQINALALNASFQYYVKKIEYYYRIPAWNIHQLFYCATADEYMRQVRENENCD
jgi:hypothetical protein